jgi:hypothetical protein
MPGLTVQVVFPKLSSPRSTERRRHPCARRRPCRRATTMSDFGPYQLVRNALLDAWVTTNQREWVLTAVKLQRALTTEVGGPAVILRYWREIAPPEGLSAPESTNSHDHHSPAHPPDHTRNTRRRWTRRATRTAFLPQRHTLSFSHLDFSLFDSFR